MPAIRDRVADEQLGVPDERTSDGSEIPPSGPGSRVRRRWFLIATGLLLVAVVWTFREVLLPFLLALIVAYVLSPLVEAGQRVSVRGRSLPRWTVVALLYLVLLSGLSALVAATIPRLSDEFARLAQDAPLVVDKARTKWLPELERRLRSAAAPYRAGASDQATSATTPAHPQLSARSADELSGARGTGEQTDSRVGPAIVVTPQGDGSFEVRLPRAGLEIRPHGDGGYRLAPPGFESERTDRDIATTVTAAVSHTIQNTEKGAIALMQTAQKVIGALTRGIFGFVMMLMLSAYLLVTGDRIHEFVRSFYPASKKHQFDDLVRRLDRGLSGVVRGQLTISLVNGVLSGIGFYLLGLKYWVFLTLLAGVMSIIPIFGSILSTIPAVLVALPEGLGLALLVLAWIVGIHQLEANLLNPKIMGDAARVHPVLVVFALLAGEHVAGIAGALFAVPVLSITQTLFLYLRERNLGIPRPGSLPPPPPAPEQTQASQPWAPEPSDP